MQSLDSSDINNIGSTHKLTFLKQLGNLNFFIFNFILSKASRCKQKRRKIFIISKVLAIARVLVQLGVKALYLKRVRILKLYKIKALTFNNNKELNCKRSEVLFLLILYIIYTISI